MLHNGVVGDENYLAVSGVFVEREGWNRTDCVTYSDVGNIFPHGIDNPGSIISQTGREFYRFSIFIVAPVCIGGVVAVCLVPDTSCVRAGGGDFDFYEFEDFRT